MNFNLVLICIPILIMRLSIFSYIGTLDLLFHSIGIFLFLGALGIRYIFSLNILNTNSLSAVCNAEVLFQAWGMIFNLFTVFV